MKMETTLGRKGNIDFMFYGWCIIACLFPGLYPNGYEAADSGWPRMLKSFAAEAWRRAEAGELADEELYPSDSQWSGLYDRMFPHTADEMERRLALAADYGEANAADVLN
jgi:hypothetical protein